MTGGPPGAGEIRALEWRGHAIGILDQRELPHREVWLECTSIEDVGDAIRGLAVRGAPILGVTAALGLALVARTAPAKDPKTLLKQLERAGEALAATRPTAVNIAWAIRRVLASARRQAGAGVTLDALRLGVLDEARRIETEDREACDAMGAFGSELVPDGANVLTHCNTGALCTSGIGTALGVIVAAQRSGKRIHVWVDETRPVWQGARLTAWELQRLGIPMTLVPDTAAGSLMARGMVDLIMVGADRIAANGDAANKIGTYTLAVLADRHDVPFYVVAPTSTVDLSTPEGSAIEIEEREPAEVVAPQGLQVAPEGTPAANPAFDVTPAALLAGIVTERGVARKPFRSGLRRLMEPRRSA